MIHNYKWMIVICFFPPTFFSGLLSVSKAQLSDWTTATNPARFDNILHSNHKEWCSVTFKSCICQTMCLFKFQKTSGCFLKYGYHQIHFTIFFHYEASILGYPPFRKPPSAVLKSLQTPHTFSSAGPVSCIWGDIPTKLGL